MLSIFLFEKLLMLFAIGLSKKKYDRYAKNTLKLIDNKSLSSVYKSSLLINPIIGICNK